MAVERVQYVELPQGFMGAHGMVDSPRGGQIGFQRIAKNRVEELARFPPPHPPRHPLTHTFSRSCEEAEWRGEMRELGIVVAAFI